MFNGPEDYFGRGPTIEKAFQELQRFRDVFTKETPSVWLQPLHRTPEDAGALHVLNPTPRDLDPQNLSELLKLLDVAPEDRWDHHVVALLPLLQSLHTVHNMPLNAQRALCGAVSAAKIEQGQYVYRKGETSDACYVVLDGSVHLVIPGDPMRHSHDIEMAIIHPGKGFGDVALVDPNIVRATDAIAIDSSCILLKLDLDDYELIINAVQTEELIKVLQIPAETRSDTEVKLVQRIICKDHDYFGTFSEDEQRQMARAFTLEHWDTPGATLFNTGMPAEVMFVSLSCVVEMQLVNMRRRRQQSAIFTASLFGRTPSFVGEKPGDVNNKDLSKLLKGPGGSFLRAPTSENSAVTTRTGSVVGLNANAFQRTAIQRTGSTGVSNAFQRTASAGGVFVTVGMGEVLGQTETASLRLMPYFSSVCILNLLVTRL